MEPRPGPHTPQQSDEEFRVGPHRPRLTREPTSRVFRVLQARVRKARTAAKRSRRMSAGRARAGQRPACRCVVKVRWSAPTGASWARHGSYISRGSATGKEPSQAAGFDESGARADIPKTLRRWQRSGDEVLYKVIISPADSQDLETLTRALMRQVEVDIGRGPLEWVGAVHTNTAHPHAHLVIRSRARNGQQFTMSTAYQFQRLREIATHHLARSIGHQPPGRSR